MKLLNFAAVKATFNILLGDIQVEDPLGPPREVVSPDIGSIIQSVKSAHSLD